MAPKRVAVTTYNSLFNTNPFIDPEIIVVEDARAAENYIASQWTVRVNRTVDDDQGLFNAVVGVLKSVLPEVSFARLTGDVRNVDDAGWVDKFPTHKLLEIATEVVSIVLRRSMLRAMTAVLHIVLDEFKTY